MSAPLCDCLFEHMRDQLNEQISAYFVFGQRPTVSLKNVPDCDKCKSLRRIFANEDEIKLFRLLFT